MPHSKREGLVFCVTMAFTMSLFMNIFNTFRHNGVSIETLGHALALQPVIFAIVMVVEGVFVSKLAHRMMKKIVKEGDSMSASALARAVCMVTGMSFVMSLVGAVLSGATLTQLPMQLATIWPINFFVAFFWQVFGAAPMARFTLKMFRAYSRTAAKASVVD